VPGSEPLDAAAWLAAAGEPTPGDACWWEWPRRDRDGCPVCLPQGGQHAAARLTLVLLAPAPAPGAPRVPGPAPVVLVWGPASSPAWQPVARLWEDLTGRLDGMDVRGRSRLTAWQQHGADMVPRDTTEPLASLPGYAYLLEAARALSF
jgi:hypothetical protein